MNLNYLYMNYIVISNNIGIESYKGDDEHKEISVMLFEYHHIHVPCVLSEKEV